MFRLNARSVRLIPVAGVLCWVAVLFYCIYIRNYEAPAFLILVVFFAYFFSQRRWGGSDKASDPFKFLRQDGGSPIRELAKGVGCLVAGSAIAAAAGLTIPNVELGVAIALTAAVVGIVGFVLFLIRAFSAWGSSRGTLE
jgi:hypothetical protein